MTPVGLGVPDILEQGEGSFGTSRGAPDEEKQLACSPEWKFGAQTRAGGLGFKSLFCFFLPV